MKTEKKKVYVWLGDGLYVQFFTDQKPDNKEAAKIGHFWEYLGFFYAIAPTKPIIKDDVIDICGGELWDGCFASGNIMKKDVGFGEHCEILKFYRKNKVVVENDWLTSKT